MSRPRIGRADWHFVRTTRDTKIADLPYCAGVRGPTYAFPHEELNMATDVILEETSVALVGDFVEIRGNALVLDNSPDRGPGAPESHVALGHDIGDSLTINWRETYPG